MGSFEESFDPEIPIPPPTTLDSLRTSKMMPLGELSIKSGINKKPRNGRVYVDKVGLQEDEHDLTFHGGPDKAIHGYCSDNYPLWREQYPDPEISARFVPGGFGENLVLSGWNEHNVCVGDKVRIGPTGSDEIGGDYGCLLEVSIPRSPCFKLNQRFGIKNFAPRTIQFARTGWYYRVLREGWISMGMEVRVVERKWPKWTIERLHFYSRKETEHWEIMEELVKIQEIGQETKGAFQKHLKKKDAQAKIKMPEIWRDFRIAEKRMETTRVAIFTFESPTSDEEGEEIDFGMYIRLKLPNGLIRPYSVAAGKENRFQLGIAREEQGRGGSAYLHDTAKVGDIIQLGQAAQSVPFNEAASNHIFIVGGIGITAFLGLMRIVDQINYNFELHYAVRSEGEAAFKSALASYGTSVHIYSKAKGERMDLLSILKNRKWNSHVYVCGPQRMIDGVNSAAELCGMQPDEIHFEAFQAMTSGDPFTAEVEVEGKVTTLEIAEEQTLLEVMKKAGFDVPSSCEVGNCGTCQVGLRRGKVEHRGSGLSEEEKKKTMLSCVSRGIGHICVELSDE